jgi:hypothetical protein
MEVQRAALFDHLVGTLQKRFRNRKAKRFRGVEIDHETVLGRQLYRGVAGLAPCRIRST